MRILVAEDDAETARFIEHGLGQIGHVVGVVGDGHDALREATTHHWDVIVLDRMLPSVDGVDIVRRMRTDEVTTPVLLLTALGRIEDRVEGLEAGADDYLVKP
ncbi:MAG TPA: response regulator, partial [Acetobacteraceae bacterium]|nr:response regulator [Acetobacteraceae bacterium]